MGQPRAHLQMAQKSPLQALVDAAVARFRHDDFTGAAETLKPALYADRHHHINHERQLFWKAAALYIVCTKPSGSQSDRLSVIDKNYIARSVTTDAKGKKSVKTRINKVRIDNELQLRDTRTAHTERSMVGSNLRDIRTRLYSGLRPT